MNEKDKICIVTPWHRDININTFLNPIRYAQDSNNIEWYPITDTSLVFPNDKWIHPVKCIPIEGWDPCYYKLNYFISTQPIVSNNYYICLNDDDAMDISSWAKLRKYEGKCIIINLHFSFYPPNPSKHNYNVNKANLLCCRDNMRLSKFALQQMVFRGDLFRDIRFLNYCGADGLMADSLRQMHTLEITEAKDVWAWFNWLEPGRWDIKRA